MLFLKQTALRPLSAHAIDARVFIESSVQFVEEPGPCPDGDECRQPQRRNRKYVTCPLFVQPPERYQRPDQSDEHHRGAGQYCCSFAPRTDAQQSRDHDQRSTSQRVMSKPPIREPFVSLSWRQRCCGCSTSRCRSVLTPTFRRLGRSAGQ
jgi:hypothetical protein